MNGADITEEVRQRVRDAVEERCGYCLSPQRLVMSQLEIEHLVPRARGGSNEEPNLCPIGNPKRKQ